MAPFQIYRLNPAGAFHFGKPAWKTEEMQSRERCPSDTLYAALWMEAHKGGLDFFAPANGDDETLEPPFLLSSCFPYAGDVLLLPRPLVSIAPLFSNTLRKQHETLWRKLDKRLAYVSPTIFRAIIAGKQGALDAYMPNDSKHPMGRLMMHDSVWVATEDGVLPDKTEQFWVHHTTPHAVVDRSDDGVSPYHLGQVMFAPGCGLYLLCQERTPGSAANLYNLLQRLGDSGLGGRRSIGMGMFQVETPASIELSTPEEATGMVLLSRYNPTRSELSANALGQRARYTTEVVGGWLQSLNPAIGAQQRRAVRLINEGAIVQMLDDGGMPIGRVCNIAPDGVDHPVWRYGLALGVGIRSMSI